MLVWLDCAATSWQLVQLQRMVWRHGIRAADFRFMLEFLVDPAVALRTLVRRGRECVARRSGLGLGRPRL